jgi:hypothetical protein
MNNFCDLLGTPDAPVSKIAFVKGICMHFLLELKKIVFTHSVTLKQPHKIVKRHPVCLALK